MNRHVAVLEPAILVDERLHAHLSRALQNNKPDTFISCITPENCNAIVTESGERPIHLACQFPSGIGALGMLLTMNVDPNVCTDTHETPLHYCVAKGHVAGIERLLSQHGIEPYRLDMHGRSPLRLACEMMGDLRPDGLPMVKKLLDHGLSHASVNRQGDGLTVAFFAYMNGSEDAISIISDYILHPHIHHIHPLKVIDFCNDRLLLKYSEEVGESSFIDTLIGFSTSREQTVFHHLANSKYVSGLHILLELSRKHSVDVTTALNQIDSYGCRPIHYAANSGSSELVTSLFAAGASIDDVGVGYPLDVALRSGNVAAFKTLLDPTIKMGMSSARLADDAKRAWATQVDLAKRHLADQPSLVTLFSEDPKNFNTTRIIIALKKALLTDVQKDDLRKCRQTLVGIKEIMGFLDSFQSS